MPKTTVSEMLQRLAMYESSLYSCGIEGNLFAQKHIEVIKSMNIFEKYHYLKKVFDDLDCKY